jgi:hypothetical protein
MVDDGVHGRIAAFCAQQRTWLELELQDEQEQQPQLSQNGGNGGGGGQTEGRSNTALQGLAVAGVSIGLYGRTVVQFVPSSEAATTSSSPKLLLLPAHRFTTGDEVEIRLQKSSRSSASTSSSGVVSALTDASLSVALFPQSSKQQKSSRIVGSDRTEGSNNDEEPFLDLWDNTNGPFVILPRSNVQVHRKLLLALSELETKGVDHAVCGRIVQALFDPTSHTVPAAMASTAVGGATPVTNPEPLERAEPTAAAASSSSSLDASQQEAIAFALSSRQPLALIHGPVRVVLNPFKTSSWICQNANSTDPFSFRMPLVACRCDNIAGNWQNHHLGGTCTPSRP